MHIMSQQTKLRIGIVGCGRATEDLHMPALRNISGVQVTALSDNDAGRLAQVAERFGIERRYPDYQALISDPSVDVVAVCVPAAHHEPVACAAMEAGKHVYVEKPLALTERAGSTMVDSASRAAGKATLGFNLRSHRLVADAKKIIASGVIGPVEMLRTSWTSGAHFGREWPDWRYRRADGGGALFEMATHHADLWQFLLDDKVERVYAQSRSESRADDQSASITAGMSRGSLVSAAYSQCTSDSNEVTVYGRNGILRFSCYRVDSLAVQPTADLGGGPRARIRQMAARIRDFPNDLVIGLGGGDYRLSYIRHWQAFVQSIRNDAPPPCTLEDGHSALRIILAAIESARSGQPTVIEQPGAVVKSDQPNKAVPR